MGFILFITALGLSLLLYPFAFILTVVKSFRRVAFKEGLKRINQQFLDIATSIDANGNVVCDDLFNWLLIKRNGYRFGKRKETISSVLGKNEQSFTLSISGWLLTKLLNIIQTNHCKNSIDNNV